MTNLEKIRQMNDEELGCFISNISHIRKIDEDQVAIMLSEMSHCNNCFLFKMCGHGFDDCPKTFKRWLNSEVEE